MWAIAFVTACVYDPASGDPDDPGPGPGPGPGPTPIEAACHAAADPLLCLEFEADDQLGLDGSGFQRHATVDNVTPVTRILDPMPPDSAAAGFGLASSMTIAQPLELTGSVTIEMWTIGTAATLFDSSGRISLARDGRGQLTCRLDGDSERDVSSNSELEVDAWHHVACVVDASSGSPVLRLYIDGDVDDCNNVSSGIDASRTGPTAIGSGLVGGIDSVHVYGRALSPGELCASAGRTSCDATCPTGGQGNGSPGGGD